MSYCTLQDMVDRFGTTRLAQLTDKVNRPATTINDATVEAVIQDATSLVNSFLAKRYSLPLSVEAPKVLVAYCVDIAWFKLNGESAGKESAARLAYQDALAWLAKVANGLVTIEGAGENVAPAGGGQIQTSRPDRVFTRDKLSGF